MKKTNTFIDNDTRDLQLMHEKIHLLDRLNQKIQTHLEPEIAKLCQVANLLNGKLILVVANSAIATQIRFQANDLLRKFHQDVALRSIVAIECKVRPTQQTSSRLANKAPKKMAGLSRETASIVKTMAESIEDPTLREIMARIATRIKEGVK